MREEIEGIFLWVFEGLQRLLANNFQFTESERAISNRETVKRNNVNAGEFMIKFVNSGQKIDVVFMDPPRAGSDKNFLSKLVTLSPEKVVYISCNPQTQARDLLYLSKNGYKVKKIQPVDMFPHTSHVETIVLLNRQKG